MILKFKNTWENLRELIPQSVEKPLKKLLFGASKLSFFYSFINYGKIGK